jgi:hypothetical protein
MDFTDFTVRYGIICAVAVVVVYLLVTLARLAQIRLQQRNRQRAMELDNDEAYWNSPDQSVPVEEDVIESRRTAQVPGQAPAKFGEQLFRSGIEAELQQLRSELAGLKDNVAQLKAARRVSPQYNEAMLLAQRGMNVHDIAEECGISMGEAELVLALSRNKQEYEDYER